VNRSVSSSFTGRAGSSSSILRSKATFDVPDPGEAEEAEEGPVDANGAGVSRRAWECRCPSKSRGEYTGNMPRLTETCGGGSCFLGRSIGHFEGSRSLAGGFQ